jgi:hypothetical protein
VAPRRENGRIQRALHQRKALALSLNRKRKRFSTTFSTNNLVKKVHLVASETIVFRKPKKQKIPAQEAHLATSKTGK